MECKQEEQLICHGLVERLGGICFSRTAAGEFIYRAKIKNYHLNSKAATHGGFIMTFLDTGMGTAVRSVLVPGERAVTISLNVQFIGATVEGDLIEGSAIIKKKTRSLIFMHGEVSAGEKLVATAEGIWKIL